MAGAAASNEKLVERALALVVEHEIAAPESAVAAQRALTRWRERSPAHAAALQEARRRWDALGGMAAELRRLRS